MLDAISILIALTALFVWLNDRTFRLSSTVAMMAAGVVTAACVVLLDAIGVAGLSDRVASGLAAVDFGPTLMNVVIGVLLYVAALKINLRLLEQQHVLILTLAVVSTLLNTVLTGVATWGLLSISGLDIPLLHCLVFGALISPTDPIATVAILKSVGLPKKLEVLIEGESLLNDGVGAVIFAVLVGIVATGQEPTFLSVGTELLRDVGGGLLLGAGLGLTGGFMARADDGLTSRVLASLAIVFFGGYLAREFHFSYPLAMVAAGVVQTCVAVTTPSPNAEQHLRFWKTVEDVLIAGLFLMLGLLVVAPSDGPLPWGVMAAIVPLSLICRYIAVWLGLWIDGRGRKAGQLPALLTWGGLRGGISVALALSVPEIPTKTLLLDMTYAIVLCSVLVQAPTIRRLFPTDLLDQVLSALGHDSEPTPDNEPATLTKPR